MFKEAYWIKPHYDYKDVCPVFIRKFDVKARVQKAVLKRNGCLRSGN